jgi:two-component system response regulator YesN
MIHEDDQSDYLLAVRKRIEENFKRTINETELANTAGVSVSKLQHDFPAQFGINLQDYQTEVRINKAKTLLTETNKAIKQIAREVGYKSGESFCRAFKKMTNQTPSEYRETPTGK